MRILLFHTAQRILVFRAGCIQPIPSFCRVDLDVSEIRMRPNLLRVLFLNLIFAEEFSLQHRRVWITNQLCSSIVNFSQAARDACPSSVRAHTGMPRLHPEAIPVFCPPSQHRRKFSPSHWFAWPDHYFFSSLALSEMCPLVLYYSLAMEIDLLAVD